jgi:hypothetical protein
MITHLRVGGQLWRTRLRRWVPGTGIERNARLSP